MESHWIWISPLVAGIAGALIGTYGGSFFLNKFQDRKMKKVRTIAVKALKIIKEYAKSNNTYSKIAYEFNNKLSVSDKRAVLVALHKLGIPIETGTKKLNINNINFLELVIDSNEIAGMILQVESGLCDHLFFSDIESYFSANLRLNSVREIGKKYVKTVLEKSKYDKASNMINRPEQWHESFTQGELNSILVLAGQLNTSKYFNAQGNPDEAAISKLVAEIEVGIWDNYLFWEYEAYSNVIAQRNLADSIVSSMPMMKNLPAVSPQRKKR